MSGRCATIGSIRQSLDGTPCALELLLAFGQGRQKHARPPSFEFGRIRFAFWIKKGTDHPELEPTGTRLSVELIDLNTTSSDSDDVPPRNDNSNIAAKRCDPFQGNRILFSENLAPEPAAAAVAAGSCSSGQPPQPLPAGSRRCCKQKQPLPPQRLRHFASWRVPAFVAHFSRRRT